MKLAQVDLGRIGGSGGLGPYGNFVSIAGWGTIGEALVNVISKMLGVMTVIGTIWFIIQLLIAAFDYINAGENEQAVAKVHQKIINSFIGLAIVILAYALISITGRIFGIDIINLQTIIPLLGP